MQPRMRAEGYIAPLRCGAIISSNLRSPDYPERKYMLNCIVYGLKKPLIYFVVHLDYFNRRLERIRNTAIFCIQKLMEAVGKSIRGPQRMLVSHGSLIM